MAGTMHAYRNSRLALTSLPDLNSNNSFDSGASLYSGFHAASEFSMDQTAVFTAINDPSVAAGSIRTVSPKDIFSDGFGGSEPPSAAFTNLTSPDIGESPYMNDSFECSPMFHGESIMSNAQEWFPLFPEEDSTITDSAYLSAALSLPMERTISSQSMERSGSSSTGSPIVLDTSSRRKSSTTNSPAINAGVSKSRRRKGPLPPIVVDPNDKIALKRARNTLAARESRNRKVSYTDTLRTTVDDLTKEKNDLLLEIAKWKQVALAHGYKEPKPQQC